MLIVLIIAKRRKTLCKGAIIGELYSSTNDGAERYKYKDIGFQMALVLTLVLGENNRCTLGVWKE